MATNNDNFGVVQQNLTLKKRLTTLGLKENEVKVYLAVLKHGEPAVGQIQAVTGLHKQLIYIAAENLAARRLLSIHEVRGRKRFSVEDPAALEHDAEARLAEAKALVPELISMASADREVEAVRTYRGVRKIQQYYIDQTRRMQKGGTIHVLGI
jgi:sugar-specific transcriptional regulator TrmB